MDERKLRATDQRGAMLKASIKAGLNGYLVDQRRSELGVWLNGRRRFCCTLAGLNGYLAGLIMEASCLLMVVEWIDDGG